MQRFFFFAFALGSMLLFNGCSDTGTNPINTTQFNGHIYYSSSSSVYRLRLSDQTNTELFTNAEYPDITADNKILCVQSNPHTLIFSDLTGANREVISNSVNYTGPRYKQYFRRPRISYNQKYIVYQGTSTTYNNTYVVDAVNGELVATIGDETTTLKLINPSWVPDGSLIVSGFLSDNGIYKVSPDFSSVQRIDPNLSNVSEPSVSPDGKSIAFIRDGQVWIMGIDGSNPTQLYTGSFSFGMPTWSPDSKYIAACNTLASFGHIYIFDVQAKTVTELNQSVAYGNQLCWRY